MLVGVLVERVIIRHFYDRPHEDQLLVTFGLSHLSCRDCSIFLRQPVENDSAADTVLPGITSLGFMIYPTYRLALLGIVAVALLALYSRALPHTHRHDRARRHRGFRDGQFARYRRLRVFMMVFGIGAMAAGFAGIVNAPVVSLAPDVGEAILVQTFVVVVIGGVGSFPGAILGGLIAGEIISITSMFNPGYAYVMLFVAMTLVLVLRPYGLLGTAGRE